MYIFVYKKIVQSIENYTVKSLCEIGHIEGNKIFTRNKIQDKEYILKLNV